MTQIESLNRGSNHFLHKQIKIKHDKITLQKPKISNDVGLGLKKTVVLGPSCLIMK